MDLASVVVGISIKESSVPLEIRIINRPDGYPDVDFHLLMAEEPGVTHKALLEMIVKAW